MTFVSYDMTTARIRTRAGWPFIECTLPSCGWAAPCPPTDGWSAAEWRLDQVVDAAAGHPCTSAPNLREDV